MEDRLLSDSVRELLFFTLVLFTIPLYIIIIPYYPRSGTKFNGPPAAIVPLTKRELSCRKDKF